jgi:DNA-binding transcriptional MerR regulator
MAEEWTIGTVARHAGVSVDTVRYYERRGLLPAPSRRASGYRSYRSDAADRLRLIKQIQSLGLPLDDIRDLLSMLDSGSATCGNQRPRFEAVVQRIDAEIARLRAKREQILTLMERCSGGSCPLVTG